MEDVSPSQPTDAEQPHNQTSHSRPFFYVQPPSQPYLMYQWPMDPFGQYGFPGPAFPFMRPYTNPYQYMQYPGYVVPHAPMQPTDYRRLGPVLPSVASYDLHFRQHFQQMSLHREVTTSEAQTEPGEPVSKLPGGLDSKTSEKSPLKELNVMVSSTPAVTSCSNEGEKLDIRESKLESVPATPMTRAEPVDMRPATLGDSAVYDTESSRSRLEECVLSDVLPLDSSSIHEESQGIDQQHKEMPHFQSENSGGKAYDVPGEGGALITESREMQDSGAHVSDVTEKSDFCEGKALDQGEQMDNMPPEYVEVVEPLVQTMEHDLSYQILRLPCNKSTTGLENQKEVNPLIYLDPKLALLPTKRYSLDSTYPYSYYPQVLQERQSVLSPSIDELSSRDEILSTDVEDDLVSGHVYVSGGKLAETSSVPALPLMERVDEACSICTKTCACCGASLLDEDESTSIPGRYGYLEKDVAQEPSDHDCECDLGEYVKAAFRQHVSRHPLPPFGRQGAKNKARKNSQEGGEVDEQDQAHGRGECSEQQHGTAKADKVKGKGPKGVQSKSCSERQRRDGRELLDQDSWTSCSGKPRPRSCRPANGLQEKGKSVRRKAFPQQRPRRNEYDDHEESEFYQRGRGPDTAMASKIQEQKKQEDSDKETTSQLSLLECRICFSSYDPNCRRPKLLQCQHRCCSECLDQMWLKQQEIRCPWCRCLTQLPQGFLVKHLPDDQEVLTALLSGSHQISCMSETTCSTVEAKKLEMYSQLVRQDNVLNILPIDEWMDMRVGDIENEIECVFYCLCTTVVVIALIVIVMGMMMSYFSPFYYNKY